MKHVVLKGGERLAGATAKQRRASYNRSGGILGKLVSAAKFSNSKLPAPNKPQKLKKDLLIGGDYTFRFESREGLWLPVEVLKHVDVDTTFEQIVKDPVTGPGQISLNFPEGGSAEQSLNYSSPTGDVVYSTQNIDDLVITEIMPNGGSYLVRSTAENDSTYGSFQDSLLVTTAKGTPWKFPVHSDIEPQPDLKFRFVDGVNHTPEAGVNIIINDQIYNVNSDENGILNVQARTSE